MYFPTYCFRTFQVQGHTNGYWYQCFMSDLPVIGSPFMSDLPVIGSPFMSDGSPFMSDGSPFMSDGSPFMSDGSPFMSDGSPFMSGGSPFMSDGSPFISDLPVCSVMALHSGLALGFCSSSHFVSHQRFWQVKQPFWLTLCHVWQILLAKLLIILWAKFLSK